MQRRLIAALLLAAALAVLEAIGGWWSGSLALLADAGHVVGDVAALGLSVFAAWMAARPASGQRTYGHHRAEILAALANGFLLVGVSGGILWEAWQRFQRPQPIESGPMLVIAVIGLVVNLVMLRLLHGGHQYNLNVRAAWLHVAGDTIGSLGVVAAAILVRWAAWLEIDPIVSAALSVLIILSAWRLLREAVGVLMEHAPNRIDVADVRRCLLETPGVRDVHCLHVWTIASGLDALSAHVVVEQDRVSAAELTDLRERLHHAFQVGHVTLQLEPEGFTACADRHEGVCQIVAVDEAPMAPREK